MDKSKIELVSEYKKQKDEKEKQALHFGEMRRITIEIT